MKDYSDFYKSIMLLAKKENQDLGSTVYNIVKEKYGKQITREVCYFDRVDCYNNDKAVDNFLKCVYNRLIMKNNNEEN